MRPELIIPPPHRDSTGLLETLMISLLIVIGVLLMVLIAAGIMHLLQTIAGATNTPEVRKAIGDDLVTMAHAARDYVQHRLAP